ncbi:hypothetical protein Salat_2782800 [Sesamum alatum]|uniref:Uncharacterized protein n=1 Tax=Sesamum alatum TaxID=300844 RepID=A0AAE1XKM9_9LAMI|nr:hypothetical protein Salat_2782800 [Sesamum alatum]
MGQAQKTGGGRMAFSDSITNFASSPMMIRAALPNLQVNIMSTGVQSTLLPPSPSRLSSARPKYFPLTLMQEQPKSGGPTPLQGSKSTPLSKANVGEQGFLFSSAEPNNSFPLQRVCKGGVAGLDISWELVSEWPEGMGEWLSTVFTRLSEDDKPRFLTLCWALWTNRNKKVMEGMQQDPLSVVQRALDFLVRYQETKKRVQLDRTR